VAKTNQISIPYLDPSIGKRRGFNRARRLYGGLTARQRRRAKMVNKVRIQLFIA
jgi:hypothetical protein